MENTSIKSVGFDEIRSRYRYPRRALVREIILRNLQGNILKKRIEAEAKKSIDEEDRNAFIEDVYQDLCCMDSARTAAFQVSEKEITRWLKKNSDQDFMRK